MSGDPLNTTKSNDVLNKETGAPRKDNNRLCLRLENTYVGMDTRVIISLLDTKEVNDAGALSA